LAAQPLQAMVRCQSVGPTIPDDGNVLPVARLFKPASLSY
jgi:hypothetical protein